MKKGAASGGNATPFVMIFTDLDGTLLDHDTYEWEEAKPALERCKQLDVPLILVSSKTRAEMEILHKALGLTSPFISENGGGIFFPEEERRPVPHDTRLAKGLWKWSLGLPYESLVESLREIREELGLDIRGFSDMSLEEISHLTGLDQDASRLASLREYDEPFIVVGEAENDARVLDEAATRRGLHLTRGGRFYHLQGKNDKGEAVEKLIAWYGEHHAQVFSIALGDSPNDFNMLKRVDHPVLVRSSGHFPELQEMIPGLIVTKEIGPKGWNTVVLEVLSEHFPMQ